MTPKGQPCLKSSLNFKTASLFHLLTKKPVPELVSENINQRWKVMICSSRVRIVHFWYWLAILVISYLVSALIILAGIAYENIIYYSRNALKKKHFSKLGSVVTDITLITLTPGCQRQFLEPLGHLSRYFFPLIR